MNKNKFTLYLFLFSLLLTIQSQAQIPFKQGRIAISSDGNWTDPDDWGATPAALMMLAKAGLQDKLVAYTYTDHIWGNNPANSVQQMRLSINGAKNRWNFNSTKFVEAINNQEAAFNAIRDAINASTANNRLFILLAGSTHVVGVGMQRAQPWRRQFVTMISHSSWNEQHADSPHSWETQHSGWSWQDMKDAFTTTEYIDIRDQNSSSNPNLGFSTQTLPNKFSYWHWMRDHADANVRWVYDRMFFADKADISDAGMTWYLLHGDENGNPTMLKNFIGSSVGTPPSNDTIILPVGKTQLQVKHSNKCVDLASGAIENGTNIQQWNCGPGANREFTFVAKGNNFYEIRTRHDKCLGVTGNSMANGANVTQWSCFNGNNMQFKLESTGEGWFEIRARHSDKCLDVAGISNANGANIHQWNCLGGNNQQFRFE